MNESSNSLQQKLFAIFLMISIVPVTVIGYLSFLQFSRTQTNNQFNHLKSMRDIKKYQVEKFFQKSKSDMGMLVDMTSSLLMSTEPEVLVRQHRSVLESFIEKYGYHDLILILPDGNCFYTVAQKADYQTNMLNGKNSNSGLGRLFNKTLTTSTYQITDIEKYEPGLNEPSIFIAQPVMNNSKTEFVVALQISLAAINDIMSQRNGMGHTGETYLVGPDKLMRSDSFLDPVNHSIKTSFENPALGMVDTSAVKEALAGKTDAKIIHGYNGNAVLSAFAPIKVGDTTWALLAEIDEAEAFASVNRLLSLMVAVGLVGIIFITIICFIVTRTITGSTTASEPGDSVMEKELINMRDKIDMLVNRIRLK